MASSSKLISGMILEGTDQTISLATSLLETVNTNRCCAISIANATKCPLRNPHWYLHHGTIMALPKNIPSEHTGLISSHKLTDSIVGLSGVITYEIGGTYGYQQLQVMWRIPFDLNLFENKLNICVGSSKASAELYQDMVTGRYGNLVVPSHSNTPFAFPVMEFCFDIRAVMNDSGRTPLAVYFGSFDMSAYYSFTFVK